MATADSILRSAKYHLSSYCKEECGAYCCRNNHLILDREQLILLNAEGRVKMIGQGRSSMKMSKDDSCPMLSSDLSCRIHDNKARPKACSDFPIVIRDNVVIASKSCPAIRCGYLYPYMARLKKLGLEIRIIDMDWDVFDINLL